MATTYVGSWECRWAHYALLNRKSHAREGEYKQYIVLANSPWDRDKVDIDSADEAVWLKMIAYLLLCQLQKWWYVGRLHLHSQRWSRKARLPEERSKLTGSFGKDRRYAWSWQLWFIIAMNTLRNGQRRTSPDHLDHHHYNLVGKAHKIAPDRELHKLTAEHVVGSAHHYSRMSGEPLTAAQCNRHNIRYSLNILKVIKWKETAGCDPGW